MKYLIIFLIAITLISSCQSEDTGETETEIITDTSAVEAPEAEEGSGVNELTLSDEGFFNNPFMGNYKIQQLRSKHNDFNIVSKEPTENRHIQGQMDTIIKAEASNSMFTIYKAKQDELLQNAEIRGSGIELKNGIRVGMTTEEFGSRFNQIDRTIGPNATINLKNPIVPSSFVFRFNNGRLESISFDGYVD